VTLVEQIRTFDARLAASGPERDGLAVVERSLAKLKEYGVETRLTPRDFARCSDVEAEFVKNTYLLPLSVSNQAHLHQYEHGPVSQSPARRCKVDRARCDRRRARVGTSRG
jgi:hypothetical protein